MTMTLRSEKGAPLTFNELDENFNQVEAISISAAADANRAELARDAALLSDAIYTDTAAGLAATSEDAFFSVPSAEDDEYLVLYRHDEGTVATEVKRYPSADVTTVLTEEQNTINDRLNGTAGTEKNDIFLLEDANGNVTVRQDEGGEFYIANLKDSVQDVARRVASDNADANSVAIAYDDVGRVTLEQGADGDLYVPEMSTKGIVGWMQNTWKYLDASKPKIRVDTAVLALGYSGFGGFRSPCIFKIDDNAFILLAVTLQPGAVDDHSDISVIKLRLDFDSDFIPTASEYEVWGAGVGYQTTNPVGCKVKTGSNAGRLIAIVPSNEYPGSPGTDLSDVRLCKKISTDDGVTWSDLEVLPEEINGSEGTRTLSNTGQRITEIQSGKYAGRLIMTANLPFPGQSFPIFSDDGGDTWERGEDIPQSSLIEVSVADYADGRLFFYGRCKTVGKRWMGISYDGGQTVVNGRFVAELYETVAGINAPILQCSENFELAAPRLLFINHDEKFNSSTVWRKKMSARLSYDAARSFTPVYQFFSNSVDTGYAAVEAYDQDKFVLVYETEPTPTADVTNYGATIQVTVASYSEILS